MAAIDEVLADCADLDESLSSLTETDERKTLINKHIEKLSNRRYYQIPEFSKEFEWLNVSEPLLLSNQLKGKVLVLDFFTYCCINCMHVLPDLHELERKFTITDGVVVLGVHSAKFLNEKLTANILSAVLRYDITHPVVNDSEASLWHKLQIMCWPTFVIVGPQGQFLYNLVGEGHKDQLFEFVDIAVEYFKTVGEIKSHDLPISLEKNRLPDSPLKFPGKIEFNGDSLIISDSGNHRLVIIDLNGVVQEVIGSGSRGYKDGDFNTASFSSPQGTVVKDNVIYVADTDNHTVRKVDLISRNVTTVIGTRQQGDDKVGGKIGTQQIISSPWDLTLGKSPGSTVEDVLYIAMAGTHQIWIYCLQDITWYKGLKYPAFTCVRFVGSGAEENRNNSYPQKAGLAQPSGVVISHDEEVNSLFIADSESSTIRTISLKDGAVKNLVGGERDPNNLFAFGDVDGKGVEAKLQHPLGVALLQDKQQLLIADSYNHKIKSVDLKTKMCTTILGNGSHGNQGDNSTSVLNEPGGLCVDGKKEIVYIADTNNSEIKILDLKTSKLSKLPIIFRDEPVSRLSSEHSIEADVTIEQPVVFVHQDSTVAIEVELICNRKEKLNEEAPQSWKVLNTEGNPGLQFIGGLKGKLVGNKKQTITKVKVEKRDNNEKQTIMMLFQLFTCLVDSDVCTMKRVLVTQTLDITASTTNTDHVTLAIKL
ncbi:NHL repeat-containing protein 2 [Patella vulgata]|uniref:NHL repeat-containing protein 2 n=1 Tax=Patella vulgata TaxID=6465 RepID=UPI00217FB361|nr:NHL repeat-containing protein 2 [Patella vulgata]